MSYLLGTTTDLVEFYKFDIDKVKEGKFTLTTELHLCSLNLFPDKDSAKRAAQALGLKTWRYIRV